MLEGMFQERCGEVSHPASQVASAGSETCGRGGEGAEGWCE